MIVAKSLKKLNFGRFDAIILCNYWLIDMHFFTFVSFCNVIDNAKYEDFIGSDDLIATGFLR